MSIKVIPQQFSSKPILRVS